jgi:CRISPR/Cas system CSM-associated protein Csm3 (group 7 of RAMP superfamily)
MIGVRYRIHLDSPLRIGTGVPSLTSDDTVVRGPDGRAIVPSTTIKGAVRSALASLGSSGPDDATLRAVFGRAGSDAGSVFFSDACAPDGVDPIIVERTRSALTARRTAARGRLMTFEMVEPLGIARDGHLRPLVFEGVARCLTEDREVREVAALGLAAVRAIGADRSRGLGNVRIAIRVVDVADDVTETPGRPSGEMAS